MRRACYSRPDGGDTLFHRAQKEVRYHYQWIVLHEFLREHRRRGGRTRTSSTTGAKFYDAPRATSRTCRSSSRSRRTASATAMIRESYDWNRTFNSGGPPALTQGSLQLLFAFTRRAAASARGDGTSQHALPSNWIIDWRRFFDFGPTRRCSTSRASSTRPSSPQLHDLPVPSVAGEPPASLPARNLRRGAPGRPAAAARTWPTRWACRAQPRRPGERTAGRGRAVARLRRHRRRCGTTCCARPRRSDGEHLGAVGSRILARDVRRACSRAARTPTSATSRPGRRRSARRRQLHDERDDLEGRRDQRPRGRDRGLRRGADRSPSGAPSGDDRRARRWSSSHSPSGASSSRSPAGSSGSCWATSACRRRCS